MTTRSQAARARVEALEDRRLLAGVPTPDHIVIVFEENKNFGEIIGNPDAAYINSLAAGGALLTNAHGVVHPSQPNYIAMFSGSTQGVIDNNGPYTFNGPNLSSELAAAGLTFGGYADGLPSVGSDVLTYGDYARKHNPWVDFSDVPAAQNMPFTSFPTDFSQLPTVSFVVPDLQHDMHDGTIAQADAWLQQNLGGYADWAKTHNSLLIFTFDEDDDGATNQIPTIFDGQGIVPGSYNQYADHFGVLRTIEDMYGLSPLGQSASAVPITDPWTGDGGQTGPRTTYLDTLTWASATTGYGTIQRDASVKGNPITLRGQQYVNGLGTHASSTITYNINGSYDRFVSDVGVDDEVGGTGSVDFQVVGDGQVLYDSGVVTNNSAVQHIDVSVAGVQQLKLVVTDAGDGIDFDHADWAGAALTASAPTNSAPSAPTQLVASAISSSRINLSWTNTATNQINFVIDRSTDGTNFSPLITLPASTSSYADTGLTGGTPYYYRVRATNSVGSSDPSNIANATTLPESTTQVYLSDLNWTSATTDYQTVQKDHTIKSGTIALRGTTYAKGIGTHATSQVIYNLGGQYTTFLSDVGVDDEVSGQGSVIFRVLGDGGQVLYDSGVLTGASPVAHANVNVTGVQTLTLDVLNGIPGSIDYDHADWAGAQLQSDGAVTVAAPTNLAAQAVSSTEIDLSWKNNAIGQSGFAIDRSTDGTNFSPLATVGASATSFEDTNLTGASTYSYRVRAINGGSASDNSNIASATTFAADPVTVYLSNISWTSATVGYGSIQKDVSIKGNPITLNGVTYAKGLGTHAASQISYNLAGQYTNFIADVGVDDEVSTDGSVIFQVIGDGKVLFSTPALTGASPTVSINVNVAGVQTLTLVATNGIAGSIDYDHADWAGARLLSAPGVPTAPINLTAAAVSGTQVNLSWANTAAGNQTGVQVERSTDGTNFGVIATLGAGATSYSDVTGVSPNTTYYYHIEATNAFGPSAASNLAIALTLPPTSTTTYASDLTWTSATVGYSTIKKDASIKGNPITLRGQTYTKGIGTHADSTITYALGGAYKTFQSDIGIDDEVGGQGSVIFQLIADGVVIYDSGTLTGSSPVAHVNVNLTGVQQLQLVVKTATPGNIDYDHADWAGAVLLS